MILFCVGIVITSDEKEVTLANPFEMSKQILPEGAFYNSQNGPELFMIGNCDEIRKILHKNWPNATLLTWAFYILQQVWRWLHERQHRIFKHGRIEIMKLFRNVAYAPAIEGYKIALEDLFNSLKTLKYKNCVKYFEELYEISKGRAKCFRSEHLIKGANTNYHVEARFLVAKDTILRR